MFSAVALIAFSFAGMANTGGEEKEIKILEVKTDCNSLANMVVEHIELVEGISDCELLGHIRDVVYNNCMSN